MSEPELLMAHSFTLASRPPRISRQPQAAAAGHDAMDRVGAGCTRLVALPGQAALEQEKQRVRQGLQIISSAGRPPQVCMHAGVPHCAPAHTQVL